MGRGEDAEGSDISRRLYRAGSCKLSSFEQLHHSTMLVRDGPHEWFIASVIKPIGANGPGRSGNSLSDIGRIQTAYESLSGLIGAYTPGNLISARNRSRRGVVKRRKDFSPVFLIDSFLVLPLPWRFVYRLPFRHSKFLLVLIPHIMYSPPYQSKVDTPQEWFFSSIIRLIQLMLLGNRGIFTVNACC